MKLGDKMWHSRLNNFEWCDKITFEIVPRYKTSGLSGDEWRQHVEVTFWFKGHKITSWGAGDMSAASMLLGARLLEHGSPIAEQILKLESDMCDQPSCTEPPTHRYIMKRLFSRQGDLLDASDVGAVKRYRQFCERHGTRGDCDREDADDNYEKVPL